MKVTLAQPPPSQASFASHDSNPADGASRESQDTLLVVEDEPDDYALLRRALGKAGAVASVRWAQTAPEAMAVLAELEPKGRGICVVADVKLPGVDGFELLAAIRSKLAPGRVKFAFLTGRRDRVTEDRARSSGADAFFVKPTSGAELIVIARALHKLASQYASLAGALLTWLAV